MTSSGLGSLDRPDSREDDAGAAWMQGVAREWEAELNDPREDIYTLEDGSLVDEPRRLEWPSAVI